jgi:steroid 5-alpha reductase family enzyme
MLLACLNPEPGLGAAEWSGVALWIVALCGEYLADRQLARFKADPANKGRTCQDGLWRYSRHPNYFFEWLVWCAYFLFALGSPHGIWTIYCPLLMLHFLVNVTGVKLTEEHSLRSRGDEYRRYQQTTSAFVPWFRKETK